jgi:chromosome segregation ATPase
LPSHAFQLAAGGEFAAPDGRMNDTNSVAIATRRLALALEAIEAAAERRGELDRGHGALLVQIHALSTDRARLASELDHATARLRGLETANREIAQRIDRAIEKISGVLAHDQ